MKSSTSRKEISHDRIVEVASRAIRRAGYQGVGVADIMKEAGLTHGGFYAHFDSRDALLAEAVNRAGRDGYSHLAERMAAYRASGATPFEALVKAYLGTAHAENGEMGCPIAALVSEMPRQSAGVRAASLQRVESLIEKVQQVLPAPAHRDTAVWVASALIGALQLARAFGADTSEGQRLLEHTQQTLLTQFDPTHDKAGESRVTKGRR
jgi:TetR/AcrR family transcriptional repressor of nem operon